MGFLDTFRQAFQKALHDANPDKSAPELDRIFHELDKRLSEEPPPRIAVIGEAGVGKSSTINSLFNGGEPVSATRACTQRDVELTIDLGPSATGLPRLLQIVDMPGLGESVSADRQVMALYQRVLPTVDAAVWILDAQYRAVRSVQERLAEDLWPLCPSLVEQLVFGLNKADIIAPGQLEWNPKFNCPGPQQERNLIGREEDVTAKIREAVPTWGGKAVTYSALKRFRLSSLFLTLVEAVPEERRWLLGDRMDLASYEDLVDRDVLRQVEGLSDGGASP